VNFKLKKSKLTYKKLKISDFDQFQNLFYLCFKKKISLNFFKWRYFSDKFSFCYGVFESSKLIANVGMVSIKLNNCKYERIFSRHSSMVLKEYRGLGIFSDLLKKVKTQISKKTHLVIMWPNKNNFSNFSLNKNAIIKKKFYLYKTHSSIGKPKETKNYSIIQLYKFKKYIKSKDSLFFKDFIYFKNRYLSYNKNEYLINKYENKKNISFFIIKINKENTDLNHVILDHFGSESIRRKHLLILIREKKKLVFLSKKKITRYNYKLLSYLNLKIGFIKKFTLEQKKTILKNREIFLGDTDIFITTRKI